LKVNKSFTRQVLLYGVIGSASAFLDLILFTFMYEVTEINMFMTNAISVHAGIVMSFLLNRKYNFKKLDRIKFRALIFYMTGLLGLALSQGILWIGGILSFNTIMVKAVSILIVAGIQFMINKFITFGK